VRLTPDPIATPLQKDAALTELLAGARVYRRSADPAAAKQIASLVLNADASKGPFNCDFKLGGFELKLLSVNVQSKVGDTRVACRVMHPASHSSREVYFRTRTQQTPTGPPGLYNSHKFLELRTPESDKDDGAETQEVFFVTIDSISLDVNTGLWKKIMLSLVSLVVPKRPPRVDDRAPRTTA